jgi:hypothetical protein
MAGKPITAQLIAAIKYQFGVLPITKLANLRENGKTRYLEKSSDKNAAKEFFSITWSFAKNVFLSRGKLIL